MRMGATYCILGIDKWVVDSNNLEFVMGEGIAKDNATDPAESVDANFHRHFCLSELLDNRDGELAQRLRVRILV